MADSSFDIVSKVDKMEADNAVNQAQKEIAQRYDFKGVGASIEWSGEKLLLKASAEERVKAVLEVLEQKFIKRGISLRSLDAGEPYASGKEYRIEVGAQERHLERGREEDREDHPRRGAEERQEPDPGRRAARAVEEPRRPAGDDGAAQGQGPRRRPAVRELPLDAAQLPLDGDRGRASTSGSCWSRQLLLVASTSVIRVARAHLRSAQPATADGDGLAAGDLLPAVPRHPAVPAARPRATAEATP